MKTKVIITSARQVENAEAILIGSASYKGCEPFGGMFHVFDADECICLNQDGVRMVSVFCSEGDKYKKDDMLEFELHDVVTNTITGHTGEVVGSLMLEAPDCQPATPEV
jgi:hypothetical protein